MAGATQFTALWIASFVFLTGRCFCILLRPMPKPKVKKPKVINLRMRSPITAKKLSPKATDFYRCQVQMPRKWLYALVHNFLLAALDSKIADDLRDCFGVKIEARYLAHFKTAMATPQGRALFREFCTINAPTPEWGSGKLKELSDILDMDLMA